MDNNLNSKENKEKLEKLTKFEKIKLGELFNETIDDFLNICLEISNSKNLPKTEINKIIELKRQFKIAVDTNVEFCVTEFGSYIMNEKRSHFMTKILSKDEKFFLELSKEKEKKTMFGDIIKTAREVYLILGKEDRTNIFSYIVDCTLIAYAYVLVIQKK